MMDYRTMYPWAPDNLLEETSMYTSYEQIVLYKKRKRPKKCIIGRENEPKMFISRVWKDQGLCMDLNSSGVHDAN